MFYYVCTFLTIYDKTYVITVLARKQTKWANILSGAFWDPQHLQQYANVHDNFSKTVLLTI